MIGLPSQRPGVQRNNKHLEPILLRSLQQRKRNLVIKRPVELVPSLPVTVCCGYFLDGAAAGRAENVGDSNFSADFCNACLFVLVEERLDTHRGHEQWRRVLLSEKIDGKILSFCLFIQAYINQHELRRAFLT